MPMKNYVITDNHKINVLCKIAHLLNANDIVWAVGASLAIYFEGFIDEFHDIDIMVKDEDSLKAKELIQTLGVLYPQKENRNFKTKYFFEYCVEDVEIDLIGGFIIVKDGVDYDCSFTEKQIKKKIMVNNETIYLQSLKCWEKYYSLMGRNDKVRILENHNI